MEFDPAEQQYALDQALSELAEAEQQVVRRKADIEARVAQDEVSLLNARYRVRRAELDAKTPERLLSANEFQKRKLTLEEMKRRLAQTEHDVVSNRTTLGAALAVVEQARNRSRINADRARQIIDSLVVRAPIDGLVLVRENRDATGGVFYSGMSLPEYRVGDTVWSGRVITDVSDISDLEITVRVNEQDRASLVAGQSATVHADGAPGRTFAANISALSGVAIRSRDQQGPHRQFEVTLRLDSPEPQPPAGHDRPRGDCRAGGQERADGAPPGGLPGGREVGRLRGVGRPLRSTRGEGDAPVGEPLPPSKAWPRAPTSRW